MKMDNDRVDLIWGEVLGAKAYRLYRRRGQTDTSPASRWEVVHEGRDFAFTDAKAAGVAPAFFRPGLRANAPADMSAVTIYDYAVAAVTDRGQGPKCTPISTDPAQLPQLSSGRAGRSEG